MLSAGQPRCELVSTHASVRRRRLLAVDEVSLACGFNSRLREEATGYYLRSRSSQHRFNSRLREEATSDRRQSHGAFKCFNSRLREEATTCTRIACRYSKFQLTPP